MMWINKHKRIWRTAVLLLFIIALIGPWSFEIISVTGEYTCSPLTIQLDKTLCGVPMTLKSFLRSMVDRFWNMALITGEIDSLDLIFVSLLLILLLPLLSTTMLIWRGDHRHWRIFQMIILGLAAVISFWGMGDFSAPHPALWGIWLYIGLVGSILVLERLTFVCDSKLSQDWPEGQPSLDVHSTKPVIWINQHKQIWRTSILALLFIAITGPWSFDLISVPAEYPCSLPNYRLEGDFCGIPFSLLWGIPVFFSSFFRIVSGLLTDTTIPSDLSWGLLQSILNLLLFLPFLTTWSLISRGSHQSRFVVVSWVLAIGVAYHFWGNSFLARPHPELWNIWLNRGVWLYIAVAIVALILELMIFKAGSKASSEITASD